MLPQQVGAPCRHRRLCAQALWASVGPTSNLLPPHDAEESARQHAVGFVDAAHTLVGLVEKLYEGVEMPRSDFSMASLWK